MIKIIEPSTVDGWVSRGGRQGGVTSALVH